MRSLSLERPVGSSDRPADAVADGVQYYVGAPVGGLGEPEGHCMSKSRSIKWSNAPAEHDYPSAASYLRLVATAAQVAQLTDALAAASTVQQHAKDILRAARLPLLVVDDPDVAKDLKRVNAGTALSPILLVRGDLVMGVPMQIADGYHRVCASYHLDEDTDIPCRIADRPAQ
jgi:hypothetical protein